jgi:glycolate dehydrogenase FAD-binding subunit
MSTASKTSSTRLSDIVGASHVVQDPAELSTYEAAGKIPEAAVRPGTKEEVVEIIKFAAAEGLAVVSCGARTKLDMGLPPQRYDLALDLTRLNRIIAYDPADLTLAVEPGLLLRNITSALAEHRQFLPLLVPYSRQTTIGGTIASGVDSPMRQFYGTARDYILGMEFVTGEGTLAKSGGRVVKNVSGYDLHKLMIGALGTLGVMVQLNFKTFPAPVATRGFVATFEQMEQAVEMRQRVAQSPLTPITMEIFSPRVAELFSSDAAARIASGTMPADVISPKLWAFTSGFAGNDKVLARYESEFRKMAGQLKTVQVTVLDDTTRPPAFSRKREFVPIALSPATSPATAILKISVLPTHLKEALARAQQSAEANGLPWAAMARGLGVIYFALLPEKRDEDSRRRVAQAAEQIFGACSEWGANSTIPWCPSEWKGSLKVWGPERADFSLMPNVKKVFDPQGILSPGRFAGRI